ncbi:hypothetical protein BT63DRAFT_315915 [Microthyrium microscopicum]|uniref:SprT-like domain-containing protein n=1 Tax=Microthyrium microscopicum TaxID=703497 RepID=A0A6A6U538_9PEZI|nr:hypothetical protein BT63DRAFT_315915 [Microthyrium microscopicum]
MARLRIASDEENDSDDVFILKPKASQKYTSPSKSYSTPTKDASQTVPKKQRALRKLEPNAVLLAKPAALSPPPKSSARRIKKHTQSPSLEVSSKLKSESQSQSTMAISTEQKSKAGLISRTKRRVVESESDSDGSESDFAIPEPKSIAMISNRTATKPKNDLEIHKSLALLKISDAEEITIKDTSLNKNLSSRPSTATDQSRPTTSSGVGFDAFLVYEPKKHQSPAKIPQWTRPSTPPAQLSPPPKERLKSPSKSTRIPPSPFKPASDEFWSPTAVNGWIDHHSPHTPIISPKKNRFQSDSRFQSRSTSPSPIKSPKKIERAVKKSFNDRKEQLAVDFLIELDTKICNGKIAELSACTGGIKIVWNKKLQSTAGRANWKCTTTTHTHSDGTVDIEEKHFASIELADKVLDDELRLFNTIAHEFCHLTNFMISRVKNNPHGKEFKVWASKCTKAFSDRGVEVTTVHNYDIDYKYVWECTKCGIEYKRHSKSIDPEKHACGSCKEILVQIKPVPRKKAPASGYQLFIKENFQTVKKQNSGASHGAVMEILGKLYREKKAASSQASAGDDIDKLIKEVEVITLDD